jgi:hypothetical protein
MLFKEVEGPFDMSGPDLRCVGPYLNDLRMPFIKGQLYRVCAPFGKIFPLLRDQEKPFGNGFLKERVRINW